MTELHFLRPQLWWMAIPLIVTIWLLMRHQHTGNRWRQFIDPDLLPWLIDDSRARSPARRLIVLVSGGCLCWLALLGPSWQKLPAELQRNTDALVIVLDLSPSMLAQDVAPSRLQQAKFKIRDLLDLRRDGLTGLVAVAGDAFVVAPLTDDSNTLETLLPALHPDMMPIPGSNPLAGLKLAQQLLLQGHAAGPGRILLIGDGYTSTQWPALKDFADDSHDRLSILAVGTTDGAPIPLPDGGFVRDEQGNIVVPALDRRALRKLAEAGGGLYRDLTLDNSDIASISTNASNVQGDTDSVARQFDQWRDGGHWLVLLLLPLCLAAFRRSHIPAALLALTLAQSPPSHALDWQDLWQTPDQRGAASFETDPEKAARAFKDSNWRASALYRSGDYAGAADAFAADNSASGQYNRGTALAKAGKFDEAIAAFDAALALDPGLKDATKNKAIVEQLRDQQEQSQQSQQGEQGEQAQDQAGEDMSSDNPRSGDQHDATDKPSGQQKGDPETPDDRSETTKSSDKPSVPPKAEPETDNSDPTGSDEEQQRQKSRAESYAEQANSAETAPSRDDDSDSAAQAIARDTPISETEQAQEQWLRQIPEGADELLRNKFMYQARERQKRGQLPEASDVAPY